MTYEMFWKKLDDTKWVSFDSAGAKYSSIDKVISRSKDTYFWAHRHVVRVWEDSKIIYEQAASTDDLVEWLENYKHGITPEKGVMSTYIVQYLRDDSHSWSNFGPGVNKITFDDAHEAWNWARKRSRLAGYKTTVYRVWNVDKNCQEGAPYLDGVVIGAQSEANRRLGMQPLSQEESEMEYEARKALNIDKAKLVERLEASIEEARAKHDENKAKEEAELADRITALKAMVKENPAGLVKTIEGYISSAFFAKNDKGEFANSKTYISNYDGTTAEFVPDATATKLVSVLNAAVDETIEVTPSDDFYRYL